MYETAGAPIFGNATITLVRVVKCDLKIISGFFGTEQLNVLRLNLELDNLK